MRLLECTRGDYVSRVQLSRCTDHGASASANHGVVLKLYYLNCIICDLPGESVVQLCVETIIYIVYICGI